MPPWFADPAYGHFGNERKLSQSEVNAGDRWVDGGAPEGEAKDKPAPVEFAERLEHRQAGHRRRDPERDPGSTGLMDQSERAGQSEFPRRSLGGGSGGAARQRERGSSHEGVGATTRIGVDEGRAGRRVAQTAAGSLLRARKAVARILAKYNPGVNGQAFTVDGAAKFIPAGSDIVFECHYMPSGAAETDQSRVGIVLASGPPEKRYMTSPGSTTRTF